MLPCYSYLYPSRSLRGRNASGSFVLPLPSPTALFLFWAKILLPRFYIFYLLDTILCNVYANKCYNALNGFTLCGSFPFFLALSHGWSLMRWFLADDRSWSWKTFKSGSTLPGTPLGDIGCPLKAKSTHRIQVWITLRFAVLHRLTVQALLTHRQWPARPPSLVRAFYAYLFEIILPGWEKNPPYMQRCF